MHKATAVIVEGRGMGQPDFVVEEVVGQRYAGRLVDADGKVVKWVYNDITGQLDLEGLFEDEAAVERAILEGLHRLIHEYMRDKISEEEKYGPM